MLDVINVSGFLPVNAHAVINSVTARADVTQIATIPYKVWASSLVWNRGPRVT